MLENRMRWQNFTFVKFFTLIMVRNSICRGVWYFSNDRRPKVIIFLHLIKFNLRKLIGIITAKRIIYNDSHLRSFFLEWLKWPHVGWKITSQIHHFPRNFPITIASLAIRPPLTPARCIYVRTIAKKHQSTCTST